MIDFVIGLAKVLAGSFLMFTIANKLYTSFGFRKHAIWIACVCVLGFLVMLINRAIGSGITVPFLTVLFLSTTLKAIDANFEDEDVKAATKKVAKKAAYAVIVGGVIGWSLYGEQCTADNVCTPIFGVLLK